jgi:hypothetical protein
MERRRRNIAFSLILAALRGFLPLEFNIRAVGIPAYRQAGRTKKSLPTGRQALEYYIPPYSG